MNSIGEVYRSSINERKQIKIEIRIQNNELNVHVKQVDNWEQKLVERHKMKDLEFKRPKGFSLQSSSSTNGCKIIVLLLTFLNASLNENRLLWFTI